MPAITLEFLREQLEVGELLRDQRSKMFTPQELPGRYGRVVQAVDHLLNVLQCEAVLAGGWAVWHHGFVGRLTQGIDIVLPADRSEEFQRGAAVSGFETLLVPEGRWPKMRHKDTDIQVDILPEGARPGTPAKPAPTTIPHPGRIGAHRGALTYVPLPALIELKLAAGRARDEADVVELLRVNADQLESIRRHLSDLHSDYVSAFDHLATRAREQRDA
jgi:hypothetical protein